MNMSYGLLAWLCLSMHDVAPVVAGRDTRHGHLLLSVAISGLLPSPLSLCDSSPSLCLNLSVM